MKVKPEHSEDDVIDNDLILVWGTVQDGVMWLSFANVMVKGRFSPSPMVVRRTTVSAPSAPRWATVNGGQPLYPAASDARLRR